MQNKVSSAIFKIPVEVSLFVDSSFKLDSLFYFNRPAFHKISLSSGERDLDLLQRLWVEFKLLFSLPCLSEVVQIDFKVLYLLLIFINCFSLPFKAHFISLPSLWRVEERSLKVSSLWSFFLGTNSFISSELKESP